MHWRDWKFKSTGKKIKSLISVCLRSRWACRNRWCCKLVLETSGLLWVVQCQQLCTAGDACLIHRVVKTAGFSTRKGHLHSYSLAASGCFHQNWPEFVSRSTWAAGHRLQGSVWFLLCRHNFVWNSWAEKRSRAAAGLLLGEPSKVTYIQRHIYTTLFF